MIETGGADICAAPSSSLHVRHVATHKERSRFPVFTERRVGLTRPRNDTGMFPGQAPRSPYRPVLGLLFGRAKDRLKVARLITVESGDDDQLRGLLLWEDVLRHVGCLSAGRGVGQQAWELAPVHWDKSQWHRSKAP